MELSPSDTESQLEGRRISMITDTLLWLRGGLITLHKTTELETSIDLCGL